MIIFHSVSLPLFHFRICFCHLRIFWIYRNVFDTSLFRFCFRLRYFVFKLSQIACKQNLMSPTSVVPIYISESVSNLLVHLVIQI